MIFLMILRKVYKKREKVRNYSITFSPYLFISSNEIYIFNIYGFIFIPPCSETYALILSVFSSVAISKISNTQYWSPEGWNPKFSRYTADTKPGSFSFNISRI